jgi:hypothetical protein
MRKLHVLIRFDISDRHNYWIGAGTTDFALNASKTPYAGAQKTGLKTSHTAPGAHFWFIWRQSLGEFGSIIVKE